MSGQLDIGHVHIWHANTVGYPPSTGRAWGKRSECAGPAIVYMLFNSSAARPVVSDKGFADDCACTSLWIESPTTMQSFSIRDPFFAPDLRHETW